MSLLNILKKKSKVGFFTTPSHSQNFFIFSKFRQFYKYDISETDAYNPQLALELAQKKASKIYGSKSTYFLTNGSTSGVIISILACVNIGEKVLIWDKAHPSHQNAAKLAGAIPVYYKLEKVEGWGIYGKTDPSSIEGILKKEKIKALVVTSPTYEGIVSDIAVLKGICKEYGTYLIVDEAHGALYPFCDKLPISAIYGAPPLNPPTQVGGEINHSLNPEGADFVIQSLHKTAGGLNPTALLHCNVDMDVKNAFDLISTTSPSYPLLASIEKNINFLNSKKGRKKILELIENIENMKKNVPNCEFYNGKDGDLTKILVKSPQQLPLTGFEFSEILFTKYEIEDERANEKSIMLLCGIGTDLKKLKRLEKVLKAIK